MLHSTRVWLTVLGLPSLVSALASEHINERRLAISSVFEGIRTCAMAILVTNRLYVAVVFLAPEQDWNCPS